MISMSWKTCQSPQSLTLAGWCCTCRLSSLCLSSSLSGKCGRRERLSTLCTLTSHQRMSSSTSKAISAVPLHSRTKQQTQLDWHSVCLPWSLKAALSKAWAFASGNREMIWWSNSWQHIGSSQVCHCHQRSAHLQAHQLLGSSTCQYGIF